jgi:hypothetical protein
LRWNRAWIQKSTDKDVRIEDKPPDGISHEEGLPRTLLR